MRRLIPIFFAFMLFSACAGMQPARQLTLEETLRLAEEAGAGKKISDLSQETSIQDTDEVVIRRGSNNYRAQVQHLPSANPSDQFNKIKNAYYASTNASITDHADTAQSGSIADIITNEMSGVHGDLIQPGNKTYQIKQSLTIPATARLMPQKGAIIDTDISIRDANYKWTLSGSGTNEYYLEAAAGGNPDINEPDDVAEDDSLMTEATVGSLSAGEWDWGNNDTLGFNTVYVRLSDSTDPDGKAADYVEAGYTLTINSPFNPGHYQVFTGNGCVKFGAGAVEEIHPELWGIDGTADQIEINKAVDSASGLNGATIKLLNKDYNTTAKVTVDRDRINMRGCGEQASCIVFSPNANGVAMEWDAGGNMITQCSIKGIGFYSSDTTYAKVAMRLVDVDIFEIDGVAVNGPPANGWTGGSESIGLQIKGRDIGSIQNISIRADVPISIEDNPNSVFDIDHFNFHNLYITGRSDDTKPCIRVADGVNLSSVSFTGNQAWCNGSYGFYWNDTSATTGPLNLSFNNVRWEQSTSGNHFFYITSSSSYLQNLSFTNCRSGATTANKGYYLRDCRYVTFKNCFYAGTIEAFNLDATCDIINFENVFIQTGSTVSMTGLVRVWANSGWSLTTALPNNCFYTVDGTTAKKHQYMFGVRHWKGTGVVAAASSVNLPTQGTSNPLSIITLIGYSSTGPIEEGGMAFQTPSSMKLISGTTNFAVSSVAGKLCLIKQAGYTLILNQTAQDLKYVVQIEWVE